jgi:C-terminal general transcription factor TFIIE alpha
MVSILFARLLGFVLKTLFLDADVVMSDDDEDDDDMSPTVLVNGKSVNLLTVNDEVIAQMTAAEKEAYIHAYQDYYTNLYE